MTLLRAMDPAYSTDADILRAFYPTENVALDPSDRERLTGRQVVGDVIDPETGEVYLESGETITPEKLDLLLCQPGQGGDGPPEDQGHAHPDLAQRGPDQHARRSAAEDLPASAAGQPAAAGKGPELFKEKFQDPNRYRLGKVGRFRINRKFDQDIPESEMTLRALDYLNAIRYIMKLRDPEGKATIDDIDHLGNRRVRTIDELAADELRKGFLKLRRTVQERMSIRDQQDMTPRTLINPKSISAAIEYFFGRGELIAGGGPDQSAVAADARAAAVGPRAWRPESQAGRLRRARRSHLALRPHLPDRDAGRHQHRPDFSPVDLRRRGRLRLPGHALPLGGEAEDDRRTSANCGPTRSRRPTWPRPTPRPTARRSRGPRHRPLRRRLRLGAVRRTCSTSTSAPSRWSASRPA